MLLNSTSHIVCKFQKNWMKNKKQMQNLARAPLTGLWYATAVLSVALQDIPNLHFLKALNDEVNVRNKNVKSSLPKYLNCFRKVLVPLSTYFFNTEAIRQNYSQICVLRYSD